jgi:hypothetical protein
LLGPLRCTCKADDFSGKAGTVPGIRGCREIFFQGLRLIR